MHEPGRHGVFTKLSAPDALHVQVPNAEEHNQGRARDRGSGVDRCRVCCWCPTHGAGPRPQWQASGAAGPAWHVQGAVMRWDLPACELTQHEHSTASQSRHTRASTCAFRRTFQRCSTWTTRSHRGREKVMSVVLLSALASSMAKLRRSRSRSSSGSSSRARGQQQHGRACMHVLAVCRASQVGRTLASRTLTAVTNPHPAVQLPCRGSDWRVMQVRHCNVHTM